jgi:hypothetical protein
MRTDGRLSRSPLKGTFGDAVFAVLCACGHNIRKILAHLRASFAWIIIAILTAINVHRRDLQMQSGLSLIQSERSRPPLVKGNAPLRPSATRRCLLPGSLRGRRVPDLSAAQDQTEAHLGRAKSSPLIIASGGVRAAHGKAKILRFRRINFPKRKRIVDRSA